MNPTASGFLPAAVISLDNLLSNLRVLRSAVPSQVKVIAVVKDSAYGCGSAVVAGTLEREGNVDFFAVATPSEALHLRSSGIRGSVLVLGKATDDELRLGARQDILFTCSDLDDLTRWRESGITVRFHAEIDTGMRRLGFQAGDLSRLIDTVRTTPSLELQGLFTHLASADIPKTASVEHQGALFSAVVASFRDNGLNPSCIHVANSAGTLRFGALPGCTHIRPGISLYGCSPDPEQAFHPELLPVLSLRGVVVSIRKVAAGTPVGYGGTYVTSGSTTIATIGLGYGHGVPRYLSGAGSALVGGSRYTIAGRVTMDYLMIDAGPEPFIAPGNEAVIIGRQGNERITPDDIARIGHTIGYEVMCNIGRSVDRLYILGGRVVDRVPGNII